MILNILESQLRTHFRRDKMWSSVVKSVLSFFSSVADPDFPDGGTTNPKGVAKLLFGNLPNNHMKMKNVDSRRDGGRFPGPLNYYSVRATSVFEMFTGTRESMKFLLLKAVPNREFNTF